MRYRLLLVVAAVVLLAGAATTIHSPPVVWDPPWPVRLAMGAAVVLLTVGASLTGRTGRTAPAVATGRDA